MPTLKNPPSVWTDGTLSLLAQGYAWLPDHMRASADGTVRTRLLGRRTVALRGPEAVAFFYDEQHVQRRAALPDPVLDTLFGQGAVHTLDGLAHRVRKAMFLSLLKDDKGIEALREHVLLRWREAVGRWREEPEESVVLFDETARVLALAVCDWTGVPVTGAGGAQLARDCVAMVDGFATAGPRHLRARHARKRQEEALGRLVVRVREQRETAPDGSALDVVARHRDADGAVLDPRPAAVELLNIIRPTVAIAWFVTFAAHALHRWPEHRGPLRGDASGHLATGFAHEVRRFYPFAPFVGGLAARDLQWRGEIVPAGTLLLLDLYGQHHDPQLWAHPYRFDPHRYAAGESLRHLIPQGGGDAAEGHRCPGEDITVTLLTALVTELAGLDVDVPDQDLTIPLSRMPTLPRSGFRLRLA
ncbi:cytochrome P450 [Streptomyces sp. XY413]|uniref:cytochrome P450 n=1 Tax=Streptomyces sp. XY413 TaxID=1519479 RepID=UPI0006AF8031|nr:cytochrome P450 [Streptomyces sp. XY413]KOV25640.1 cytochrome P450 [Streptomyces sp. XY413]